MISLTWYVWDVGVNGVDRLVINANGKKHGESLWMRK